MKKKVTVQTILKKKGKTPITCLTSYTKTFAQIVDKHCDIILVGDSVGTVIYGMNDTKKVTLDMMLNHAKSVRLGVEKSLLVVDMPFKTYTNKNIAYRNAKKLIKESKCDAVKLEGGIKISNIVKYLVKKKIPVMGHVGLLPQYTKRYKVQGASKAQRKKILKDAVAISKAGAFAVVIECVVENLARELTNLISIPTIGIGASKFCDGQVLVIDDMIGLSNFYPKFVKRYDNVNQIIATSIKNFCKEVKTRRFPSMKNVYKK
jgi:3-methyl-2-oxobutanoate hydroxymethyltransferase